MGRDYGSTVDGASLRQRQGRDGLASAACADCWDFANTAQLALGGGGADICQVGACGGEDLIGDEAHDDAAAAVGEAPDGPCHHACRGDLGDGEGDGDGLEGIEFEAEEAEEETAAVHGEGRDEIEPKETEVDVAEEVEGEGGEDERFADGDAGFVETAAGEGGVVEEAEGGICGEPDEDIDERAGDGDEDVAFDGGGWAFEEGDAAEHAEGNSAGADAEAAGHEGVAELVEEDTAEEHDEDG